MGFEDSARLVGCLCIVQIQISRLPCMLTKVSIYLPNQTNHQPSLVYSPFSALNLSHASFSVAKTVPAIMRTSVFAS